MKVFSRVPAFLGAALLLLWIGLNTQTILGDQHGAIRFALTAVFALLILLRPKPEASPEHPPPGRPPPQWAAAAALLGAAAVVIGLIAPVRQVEWIGLLLLVYACLAASLPPAHVRDIPAALLVLYWINPLPNALFGTMQAAMQSASVHGAERLLHLLRAPVWADGVILRTGARVFEVPVWCSGMRTAVTVFILSLAIGILRRLNPFEILLFIAWSLAHALALNILRIAAMVRVTPWLSQGGGGTAFLHDTAGLIVIAAVFLVYIELLVLEYAKRRRRRKREMLPAALEGALSGYPRFWHLFLRRRGALAAVLLLPAAAGFIAWRSRPQHRTAMLREVAEALRENGDLGSARRLAAVVAARIPDNMNWRFTVVRMDLIAGEAQRALDTLRALADPPPAFRLQHRILEAYALLLLGRLEEAAAIVREIPGAERNGDPRLAMILAEMAVRSHDAAAVADHVVTAAHWPPNTDRIRDLYPFLHIHRQWGAIAATDNSAPCRYPAQAFSLLGAYMHLNNTVRAAAITLDAQRRWPNDPRLTEPLFFMAVNSGGEWDALFREHLRKIIPSLGDPGVIYSHLRKCFQLDRPDLAWTLLQRLETISPGHPAQALAAAEFGHRWFVFRRHSIGMQAAGAEETIDIKPFYLLGTILPGWGDSIQRVPFGADLSSADSVQARKALLRRAIGGFAESSRGGGLARDMEYLYARALELSGRIDLARAQLDAIAARAPEETAAAHGLLAGMYARKGAWVQVYETLRTYLIGDAPPVGGSAQNGDSITVPAWPPAPMPIRDDPGVVLPAPLLLLIEAQLELHLPLAAEFTAREAVRLYPHDPRARALLATALMRGDDAEAALQALAAPRTRHLPDLDILESEALFATQRFGELEAFHRSRLLPPPRIPAGAAQNTALPPAELELLQHRAVIPPEAVFARTAAALRENLTGGGNGLSPLISLWLDAWEHRCAGDLADPIRWLAIGRDRIEQAVALNQLTLLLCREGRFADALPAARLAVAALPESARLWRLFIGLEGGNPETIELARRFRPDDAGLWLAGLVAHTRPGGQLPSSADDWDRVRGNLRPLIDEALAGGATHPAALARAADYLRRGGLHDEADRLAVALPARARGLLPAYMPAIQKALRDRNRRLALDTTAMAISAAIAPPAVLYENFVRLKAGDGDIDTGSAMTEALRFLRRNEPGHPLWPQLLGYIRFRRGGGEALGALSEMNSAIAGGATNLTPYLVSAEISRTLRNYGRAAETLRLALELHPGHPVLINNLAYTLVHDETRLAEALSLLPALASAAEKDSRIRDTLALVLLRSGNPDQAREAIVNNLREAEPGSPLWFRCQMHLAEMAWRQGHDQAAVSMLEQLLRGSKNIPDADIIAANTLYSRITAGGAP